MICQSDEGPHEVEDESIMPGGECKTIRIRQVDTRKEEDIDLWWQLSIHADLVYDVLGVASCTVLFHAVMRHAITS
jgi:hypothetical protein